MASFEASIKYTLSNEGGYVVDNGGPTNYGVRIHGLAKHRGVPESAITAKDIHNMSREEAEAILKEGYWDPIQLDKIEDQSIATCIFDTAVNRGPTVAVKYAQMVCNLYGGALVVDGKMGYRTISQLCKQERKTFITSYFNFEMAGYEAIVAKHPDYHIYLAGWTNRAKRLFSLI